MTEQIGGCISQYFDPQGGLFSQRVRGLIGEGEEAGELEQIIRRQVDGDGSTLSRMLAAHIGQESPLMRVLNPESKGGVVQALAESTEKHLIRAEAGDPLRVLAGQQGRCLVQARGRADAKNHGDVGKALEERIGQVAGEFSLDKEDSALSRLVSRVESAQSRISSEFSLDEEGSALARMRRELLDVLERERRSNAEFQREVTSALAAMTARRQEVEKTTQHGLVFEDAVFALLLNRRGEGETVERTGNTTGLIRLSKRGDFVMTLGPESAAPGARIVIEAKEDQSYSLQRALVESEEARKNRDAGIGLFVFSRRSAPKEVTEPLTRYGDHVLVLWDAEDPTTNAYFTAALSVARALSVRGTGQAGAEASADMEAWKGAYGRWNGWRTGWTR